jgi:16S rRNA (uracil1498-N3)-methyltransferase
MHRFYIPTPDIKGDYILIEDPRILHQLTKVLRMRHDDEFHIFGATGEEWLVKIEESSKKRIATRIIQPIKNDTESPLNVSLYQAIPKKIALFELIVQKATEIGVSEIFPLITERTENRRLGKFERIQTIAIEAAEQSGRNKVPIIHHPVFLSDVLPKLNNAFMGYEYEDSLYLSDYQKEFQNQSDVQVIIGPEGGLSAVEIEKAKESGVRTFTFGPRILRTETAAIAALSLIMLNKPEG